VELTVIGPYNGGTGSWCGSVVGVIDRGPVCRVRDGHHLRRTVVAGRREMLVVARHGRIHRERLPRMIEVANVPSPL